MSLEYLRESAAAIADDLAEDYPRAPGEMDRLLAGTKDPWTAGSQQFLMEGLTIAGVIIGIVAFVRQEIHAQTTASVQTVVKERDRIIPPSTREQLTDEDIERIASAVIRRLNAGPGLKSTEP